MTLITYIYILNLITTMLNTFVPHILSHTLSLFGQKFAAKFPTQKSVIRSSNPLLALLILYHVQIQYNNTIYPR